MTNDTLTIDTHPRSATIGEIAKAIADAVGMDPHAMAAIKEWQNSRAACIKPSVTQVEINRLASAEAALASVVCK